MACTSDHAQTVLELASAGLGVGILPAPLRECALRRRLEVARLAEPWARVRIVALWRRTHGLAPSTELLLDTVSRHNKPRVVSWRAQKKRGPCGPRRERDG